MNKAGNKELIELLIGRGVTVSQSLKMRNWLDSYSEETVVYI